MDKPIKPIETLAESFGGIKENFTEDKIENGYQPDIPDILGGANLNYLLDTLGKKFLYNDSISDYIRNMPIENIPYVDNNNKLVYTNDVSFKAKDETISGVKTFTQPVKIQSGVGTGSLIIGGDVNAGTLTNGARKLARVAIPTQTNIDLTAILLGFDSSGDADLNITNKSYDNIAFGGSKKITNATSPMSISFCVATERNAKEASKKRYTLEMDSNEARFNVQPKYNGVNLATTVDLQTKQDTLIAGENIEIVDNVISAKGGGREVGEFVTGFWSAGFVPENLLYCDGTELSGASGQMFSNLYNDYLVGKVQLINGYFYLPLSQSFNAILAFKTGDDITTLQELVADQTSYYNIFGISNGSIFGYDSNSTQIFDAEVIANTTYYLHLKVENGTLYGAVSTSKNVLGTYVAIRSNVSNSNVITINTNNKATTIISTSTINGKALYSNGSYCVETNGTPTITDGGYSIEGARLDTCSYSEYETELTMTGSCWKWAVDIENQKFRIPFIPDKVLTDIDDIIGVRGNGTTVGLTNNVDNYGLSFRKYGDYFYLSARNSGYGEPVGTDGNTTVSNAESGETLGIVTDASKSGIEGVTTDAKTYKTIRHYVVVATGSINQNEADWSEFASSLASKANKTDVDGQWVAKKAVLTQSVESGETIIDVSEYLPNDSYQYEVLLLASWGDDGSNDYYIYSDIIPKSSLALYTSTYGYFNGGYITLPVGIDRVIYQYLTNKAVSDATRGIEALAYRRIGRNQ